MDRPDREKMAHWLFDFVRDRESLKLNWEQTKGYYLQEADSLLALIPDIEQIDAMLVEARRTAKKQVACALFEEIICPMCYRLNPQHATMDYGKGCHYCQEREDWQALKENDGR